MKSDQKAWKRFHEKMLSYEKLEYTRSQIASLLSNVWRLCEWEDTWPSCKAGGGGGGIWRDFVELEAEAVALVVRLPQPLKAHSSRPQSIVTTILSSNIKRKRKQYQPSEPDLPAKNSTDINCQHQIPSQQRLDVKEKITKMPFAAQKPPPKPIKCVRKVRWKKIPQTGTLRDRVIL